MEKVDLDYNKVAPTLRKNILRKLSVLVLTGVMLAPTVTSIVTTPIVAHAEGETEGGFGSDLQRVEKWVHLLKTLLIQIHL